MPPTLEELRPVHGGKAAALMVLREHGFRVPDFLVSPVDLAAAVEELGFPLVVRSSATVEDAPHTSFAGQFESYLNLNSLEDVKEAVRACHESVRRPGVLEYCRHAGIDPGRLRMEFLLQRMITPELAGVAFTVNPVTGRDDVVIEACEGLADDLLAGTREPLAADHPLVRQHGPRIAAEARSLQRFWGAPQDIEFALADGELYILQTRPITRIAFAEETTEWTNADFRDGGVSATVCTPLMWSLYERIWNTSLKQSLYELHLFEQDFEAARLFFGRPYWNLGAVKRCVSRIPGYVERDFDEDLNIEPAYEDDGVRTPVTCGRVLRILPTLRAISRFFRSQEAAAERVRQLGFAPIAHRYPLKESVSAAQLTEAFRSLVGNDYVQLECTYFRTIFALSLAKLDFHMAFPDTDYTQLVSALPPLTHMAPVRRLREMRAAGAVDLPAFLAEFPHHSRFGLDLCHPRWDEDREFVEQLANRLFPSDDADDTRDEDRRRVVFEQARHDARRRVALWRRRSFDRKLSRLRRFVWLREELRDLSSRMYHLLRRHVMELARLRGLGEDIFFMTYREIFEDDRSAIAARRDIYESYRNFAAPNEIGPRVVYEPTVSRRALSGIAASTGRAQGAAWIARNIDEALRAPARAVLVCPFTEPSWTPVLERVSAVVTETGGLLSHAAVICREYGIPAVLGVPHATQTIPHECEVLVDGGTGQIELISPSRPRPRTR